MTETVLVTGASGGIGLDLAREFAKHGCNVALVARSADRLAAAAEELRGTGVQVDVVAADLSLPDAGKSLVAGLKGRNIAIDVLVNNAGFGLVGRFDQLSFEEQMGMIHLNVTTLVALTRLLLPEMVARRRGRVLNVASTAAFQPGPLMAVYYATKAFVVSFSEALWEELRGTGVTVTALCPGPVATNFAERAGATKTNLFQNQTAMDSASVARAGYRACIAGDPIVVPGAMNLLGTYAVRFMPRRALLRMVQKMNSSKQ